MNVRHRYATFALLTGLLAPLATGLAPVRAQEAGKPAADEPVPTFDVAYINNAANIKLGEQVWQERVGGNHSASPVFGDRRIYFLSEEGETTVINVGSEFKVLAKNALKEKCQASIAISQGQIFIRGEKNLYCIGKK